MPRGMVLWSAKVPKALCQSSNEPFSQSHAHQKNSDTSFCVQYFFKKLNYRQWTQNHCVSGLLVPFLLLCTCFFDFSGSWDWQRPWLKIRALLKLVSETPKNIKKRYVHRIGAGGNLKALALRFPIELGMMISCSLPGLRRSHLVEELISLPRVIILFKNWGFIKRM